MCTAPREPTFLLRPHFSAFPCRQRAAQTFAARFYKSLICGLTVHDAFDAARRCVIDGRVQLVAEADKFRLLPLDTRNHHAR